MVGNPEVIRFIRHAARWRLLAITMVSLTGHLGGFLSGVNVPS